MAVSDSIKIRIRHIIETATTIENTLVKLQNKTNITATEVVELAKIYNSMGHTAPGCDSKSNIHTVITDFYINKLIDDSAHAAVKMKFIKSGEYHQSYTNLVTQCTLYDLKPQTKLDEVDCLLAINSKLKQAAVTESNINIINNIAIKEINDKLRKDIITLINSDVNLIREINDIVVGVYTNLHNSRVDTRGFNERTKRFEKFFSNKAFSALYGGKLSKIVPFSSTVLNEILKKVDYGKYYDTVTTESYAIANIDKLLSLSYSKSSDRFNPLDITKIMSTHRTNSIYNVLKDSEIMRVIRQASNRPTQMQKIVGNAKFPALLDSLANSNQLYAAAKLMSYVGPDKFNISLVKSADILDIYNLSKTFTTTDVRISKCKRTFCGITMNSVKMNLWFPNTQNRLNPSYSSHSLILRKLHDSITIDDLSEVIDSCSDYTSAPVISNLPILKFLTNPEGISSEVYTKFIEKDSKNAAIAPFEIFVEHGGEFAVDATLSSVGKKKQRPDIVLEDKEYAEQKILAPMLNTPDKLRAEILRVFRESYLYRVKTPSERKKLEALMEIELKAMCNFYFGK